MKVIKIDKTYRNGTISHFKVIHDEMSKEGIDNLVEMWCEDDPTGQSYGYTYDWNFVDDKDKIRGILKHNIDLTKSKINKLIDEKNRMEKYLSEL